MRNVLVFIENRTDLEDLNNPCFRLHLVPVKKCIILKFDETFDRLLHFLYMLLGLLRLGGNILIKVFPDFDHESFQVVSDGYALVFVNLR